MVTIVLFGADAIADSRRATELERAETTLLQLDSRGSLVALGDSNVQSLPLGATGDGQWDVVDDAGSVRIVHYNYSRDLNETLYEGPLGGLVYRNGEASVAYQAGGVWRSEDGRSSVMVSPPEFHYRAETLVFPIVHIDGTDSMSGTRSGTISGDDAFELVYPNSTHLYGNGNRTYENPIRGGTVIVTVQSDYYQAWARFFAERSGGVVSVDDMNRTVAVELSAPRFIGAFEMPNEGSAIPIRGITDGHALETFTIDLAPDGSDAARFNNLQWSLYIDDGPRELELHLKLRKADDDSNTLCKEQLIEATLYYSDTNANTYHGWHNQDAFRTTCVDRDGDGDADEVRLAVNLTGNTPMYMEDLAANNLLYLDASNGTRETTITFDEHKDTVGWEPITFSDGGIDERGIGDLMKHYFALFGSDYDIVVADQNSDSVNEDDSAGVLEYNARGRVTYMHVTADSIEIDLE